ncbi:MAG: Na/Pi cotransporter family protein [Alphaproteobacteria bacterium]
MVEATTHSFLLIDLMGAVALLLWGMRMVRTGLVRAFGADLRNLIGKTTSNRFTAYLSGVGITAVLQSATATALMTTSFANRSLIPLTMALAVMLGADLGSALVAQILTVPIIHLAPFLIFIGVVAFFTSKVTRWRDMGRVGIGLGLMLISLRMIGGLAQPLQESATLQVLMEALAGETLPLILLAAVLTWIAHSSLAIVLLIASLALGGVINLETGAALILGANLGGIMPPIIASLTEGVVARRISLGNAGFKIIGVIVAIIFMKPLLSLIEQFGGGAGQQLVNLHGLFNLSLGIIFLGLIDVAARLVTKSLPAKSATPDPGAARYLDRSTLGTPSLALTCAARETLHMGDLIGTMLERTIDALMTDDRKLVAEISKIDNYVDRLHESIKLFVTEVTREALDEAEGHRATEIITFTTNLENIGDIIEKGLMERASKKLKHKLSFSTEGERELRQLHSHVLANLKLALGVFMSGDVKIARQLLDDKVLIRNVERASALSHLDRLRQGRTESIESSALHLDVLSDLKRIYSHICSVAYPVLDAAGQLHRSRLIDGTKTSSDEEPYVASSK